MLQAFYPSIGPICPAIVHNENKVIGMVEETICAPPIGHNLARPPLGVCCCWREWGGCLCWGLLGALKCICGVRPVMQVSLEGPFFTGRARDPVNNTAISADNELTGLWREEKNV